MRRAAGNPFCAARFEPGALPWVGELEPLVDRVCVRGARLQVVGPHGSGKSTLLVHLGRGARQRGWEVHAFRGSRGIDPFAVIGPRARPLAILLDEAEEVGAAGLWLVRGLSALRDASLVVTAHRDLGLETLCERAADAETVRSLIQRLLAGSEGAADAPSLPAVEALLERHQGNVREVFFDLYDSVGAR